MIAVMALCLWIMLFDQPIYTPTSFAGVLLCATSYLQKAESR